MRVSEDGGPADWTARPARAGAGDSGDDEAAAGEVRHARLRHLLTWWESLPRPGPFPSWQNMDFRDIRDLMGDVAVFETGAETAEGCFGMFGPGLVELFGTDLRGVPLREVRRGWREPLAAGYARAVAQARPAVRRDLPLPGRRAFEHELLLLPFSDGNKAPLVVLSVLALLPMPGAGLRLIPLR